jgi:hypothetical protein
MADRKDLLGRLSDAGEDAISKVGEMPGATRITGAFGAMRDRIDELQRRLRGLEEVEKRLAALEKKVEQLTKEKPKPRSGTASTRKPAAKKTASS